MRAIQRFVLGLSVAVASIVPLIGCTPDSGDGGGGGNGNGGGQLIPLTLGEVRFWGYQIQALDAEGAIDALAESHYDMLVIEPTRTNAELSDFDTKGMVDRLKATKAHDGVHRKLIIAYVDVGEAEDWRWYWTWSKESEQAYGMMESPVTIGTTSRGTFLTSKT